MPGHLADRRPDPPAARLVAGLAPPARFDGVRFTTYEPAHPTQAAARERLEALAGRLTAPDPSGLLARWRRRDPVPPPSVYLDGGFGVGKTHLLASLWHAVAGAGVPATYASFSQLVALVGALSMRNAVSALEGVRLVCIDEFELDDPANTRLIANLLGQLVAGGACVVATSNTLPGELGAGRFDADRFRREIETLEAAFEVVTIDGEDYRHRGAMQPPPAWPRDAVLRLAATLPGATLDPFGAALAHLATVHPARYPALVEGLPAVCLTGAHPVEQLHAAVRLSDLVDVLYDAEVPVALSGAEVAELFPATNRSGPYAKKFGRAISRLGALLSEAGALAGGDAAASDAAAGGLAAGDAPGYARGGSTS